MQQTTSTEPAYAEVPAPIRSRRPLMDTFELCFPSVAAVAVRVLLRMPMAVRRRVFTAAFARAEESFNRGDFEAVTALWADDVEYAPPPALRAGAPIVGRANVLAFLEDVLSHYERSRIVNLSIDALGRTSFVRTARLSHQGPEGTLAYVIRQTTDVDRGRVIRQVNEEI